MVLTKHHMYNVYAPWIGALEPLIKPPFSMFHLYHSLMSWPIEFMTVQ